MVVLLLILGTLVIVVAVLARPLRRPAEAEQLPAQQDAEEAKLAKYGELRELELDWRTGKLSDEDYHRTRSRLRSEAAALLEPSGRS